jgi:ferric-dicitrate binding protein FerR (iron transport regulator)
MRNNNNTTSEEKEQIPLDRSQRVLDVLLNEDISPELRTEIQQYVRSNVTEPQLEEAFLRYAQKLEPVSYGGKLEGEALVSYNNLAARLGLKQIAPDTPATTRKTTTLRRSRLVRISMRVAAVLIPAALIVGGWLYMNRSPYEAEFTIASADYVQQAFLPDGTHISVEAGSSAYYYETADSRDVELTGDAFFDVTRDTLKPFHVSTSNMRLTVLGTEFAVSESAAMVSLFEGSVEVDAGATSNTLSWGERLTYDEATGTVDISIIPSGEMIAEGYKPRLVFDHATFGEVLDALAYSFDTEIITDSDIDRTAGALSLNLENMALPQAIEFLIKVSREDLLFSSTRETINITRNN